MALRSDRPGDDRALERALELLVDRLADRFIERIEQRLGERGRHQPSSNGTDRLLDINQVTQELGVSRSMIYKLFGSGDLTVTKIGHRVFVRQSALQAYIESCQT